MAQTMTTSTMSEEQIERAVEIFRAKMRKRANELPKDAVQKAFGDKSLGDNWFEVLRARVEKISNPILRRLFDDEMIVLPASDGWRTIARASDVFTGYIDSDFRNWGLDVTGKATPETPTQVLEMAKDATFAEMFDSFGVPLDQLSLTQHQIIDFCVKHRDHLRTEGYGTFFLFKVNGQFFVALVDWFERELKVSVVRLARDRVWRAVDRHRVVVPQLRPVAPSA